MKIQEILFPQIGRCTEEELYFRKTAGGRRPAEKGYEEMVSAMAEACEIWENRGKVSYDSAGGQLNLEKGGNVRFDTYFNGFSMEKWKKYTILSDLSLELELSGHIKVTLISEEKVFGDIIRTVLAEYTAESEGRKTFTFAFPEGNGRGMYSFELEALSDGCRMYGGNYTTDVPEDRRNEVRIGIGICTFRREAFIEKNLGILRECILENASSPMRERLEIFISDNGKTLERERLQTEHIHIYPNRNLGGAGGFTRDLIEMSGRKDELRLTHALLMDDDIVIEPQALVRTWTLLTLLKEEYAGAFVGGAMLRLDKQSVQVENGAAWNGGALNSLKHGLDMRLLDSCLYNEYEEYTEFNAWWYCCFPLKVVREDNLPLPIFIRGDDLEYGLRNMKTLILLNGICVWHEPFENKYSSYLEYYIVRNQLIDNAFHCRWYGKKQLRRELWTHCKQEIMYYRYKNVDLYIQGIEDFLKGPGWLMEQDGEMLHQQVMASGYRAEEPDKLGFHFSYPMFEASVWLEDTKKARWKRLITLNGLLLPARGEAVVPMAALKSVMFYRKRRVLHYDATSRKGFVTEKNGKEAWRCIFKTFHMYMKLSGSLEKAQKRYREEGLKLRTLEFWRGYLGLEEKQVVL